MQDEMKEKNLNEKCFSGWQDGWAGLYLLPSLVVCV